LIDVARLTGSVILISTFFATGPTSATGTRPPERQRQVRTTLPPNTQLTRESRLAFIRRAQIWTRTDVPTMNLRLGPGGPGAFQPNEMVVCDYVERPMHGATRKFHCALREGDVVKVRYGARNGEVQGSVLATRLLWALGFEADRVYPVRVTCRGCSSDPWQSRRRVSGEHVFDPAVIERKPHGHEMREGKKKAGWGWRDLDLVDASQGGAPVQQRDALKLLAVFMQHTDTKPAQQRLLCLPGGLTAGGRCDKPFLMLHDVGLTFGHANTFNHNSSGSVNLADWASTPIWRDPAACVGHLSKSHTGTLGDPRISEAGRRFLADLLVQLSDRQLRDLFEVAGAERRQHKSDGFAPVEEWVGTFKHKRDEIVMNRCPQ
jgi:hypothetical protein